MTKLKDDLVVKAYYSMVEIADILEVSAITVRSWKQYFFSEIVQKVGYPKKVKAYYLERFKLIYMLIRVEQHTFKGVERKLEQLNNVQKQKLIYEFNERKLL